MTIPGGRSSTKAAAPRSIAASIERYLRSGDTDPLSAAWPGSILERGQRAREDLRSALIQEVTRLAKGLSHVPLPCSETAALTRRKVEPMVRGLFPRREQDTVLAMLERSVVFLTRDNLEQVLRAASFHGTAWDLANLYLESVGARLLADDAPRLLGMSVETTCYVSADYFGEDDPFSDFVVHEAAHVFHNCKRATLGLPATRRREWLLNIQFQKRETFAYACEAFARIGERAETAAARRQLAEEFAGGARVADARVEAAEVADIVRSAAAARNGWKTILARCAPETRRRVLQE